MDRIITQNEVRINYYKTNCLIWCIMSALWEHFLLLQRRSGIWKIFLFVRLKPWLTLILSHAKIRDEPAYYCSDCSQNLQKTPKIKENRSFCRTMSKSSNSGFLKLLNCCVQIRISRLFRMRAHRLFLIPALSSYVNAWLRASK